MILLDRTLAMTCCLHMCHVLLRRRSILPESDLCHAVLSLMLVSVAITQYVIAEDFAQFARTRCIESMHA
jgi:hypothetical protein